MRPYFVRERATCWTSARCGAEREDPRCYASPSSPSPEWPRLSVLVPKRTIRRPQRRIPHRPLQPLSLNRNRQSSPRRLRRSLRLPAPRLLLARWRRLARSRCRARVTHRAGSPAATCNSKSARSPVQDRSIAPLAQRATRSRAYVCRVLRRNRYRRTVPACLLDEGRGDLLLCLLLPLQAGGPRRIDEAAYRVQHLCFGWFHWPDDGLRFAQRK